MQHPIIFFDGVCNLCTGSVKFVIKRDRADLFRFAPLQSEHAVQHLKPNGINPDKLDTIILLEKGKVYTQSTAALRIARHLDGPWPLFYAFIIIPAFIRDGIYRQIAKRRYQLWGKEDSCIIPTPALKAKFL